MRTLRWIQCRKGFDILPTYLRTYHNVTADFLTRSTDEECARHMRDLGLEFVDTTETWKEMAQRGWEDRMCVVLNMDVEDAALAVQLKERRTARLIERPLPAMDGARLVEAGATLGNMAKAWAALGGQA